jgi:hypothetical protein
LISFTLVFVLLYVLTLLIVQLYNKALINYHGGLELKK